MKPALLGCFCFLIEFNSTNHDAPPKTTCGKYISFPPLAFGDSPDVAYRMHLKAHG